MTRPHGSWCADDGDECAYCRGRINDAETERDHPERLSRREEARLDNWAEREMERTWL